MLFCSTILATVWSCAQLWVLIKTRINKMIRKGLAAYHLLLPQMHSTSVWRRRTKANVGAPECCEGHPLRSIRKGPIQPASADASVDYTTKQTAFYSSSTHISYTVRRCQDPSEISAINQRPGWRFTVLITYLFAVLSTQHMCLIYCNQSYLFYDNIAALW